MLWRNYIGLKQFGDTYERQDVQFDRWRSRTLPVEVAQGEGHHQQEELLGDGR